MHMFSPRNVYRNMWELCDAYLRLRLMQTWWHRPHQMCQMKIQFERIEKPYSKILIPIYIYIYLFWRPQILPLSVQHHNGLHTFAPLFGFPTTLGSDFSAPSQKELTIWTRFFSRSLCLASDKIYSFFFAATPKKLGLLSFPPLGKRSEYQLFLSISWPITFGVETRDRRIVELRTLRRSRPVANLFIRSLLVEGFSCHFVLEELAYQVNDCVFS